MNKLIGSAAIAACLFALQPASAQQQTNVTFARGQTSATFTGRIQGNGDRRFIVNARAGQTLRINFRPTNRSAYFNITAPRADSAMFIGSTSGNSFSGPLTVSGPHVVQVYLMRNAARRNEVANFTITIGVTGGGGGSRPVGDALVPGTNYNATAEIPCITAAGMARTRCKAGVMRMAGGETTVDIKTADGGQRYIYFKNGRASSSDANATFRVMRRGDVSVIRIGAVEVYEIPDAFVVGG
ncbi:MAG: hypothetical protein ACKVOP_14425 [Sphingomonadaceae bacterium]